MKVGDEVKLVWVVPGYNMASRLTLGGIYRIKNMDSDSVEINDDTDQDHFLYNSEANFEPVTDQQPEKNDKGEKYQREISHGVFVDIYDVLEAWGVSCPARQHAIKKLLAAGQRGHKSEIKDLQEAHNSVGKAVKFQIRREEKSNGQSLSDSITD